MTLHELFDVKLSDKATARMKRFAEYYKAKSKLLAALKEERIAKLA